MVVGVLRGRWPIPARLVLPVVIVVVLLIGGAVALFLRDRAPNDAAAPPQGQLRATPLPRRPLPDGGRLADLSGAIVSGSRVRTASAFAGLTPTDLSSSALQQLTSLSGLRFTYDTLHRRGPETATVQAVAKDSSGKTVHDTIVLAYADGAWRVATGMDPVK